MTEINLKGGQLTRKQLNTIFETIPQEFDFIDENDIVRWSSANRHRIFKRTDDDLGKHVLEVHPGHSEGRVKQVLHDMHSGDRDSISITIIHHDKPINISFYALRDDDNNYVGCVEVTQDVSNHQQRGSLWRNIKQMFNKK
ncbi:PAS domain-containing protein [Limosilactobacillus caccae]|uniref:PAS domain-containing protein n=1 Tax=Limosilactobacillus caccae TaxID=1926284 RepID=UPI00097122CF|nr:PAS domain-containing protein [Limosilactobacillus caccae]